MIAADAVIGTSKESVVSDFSVVALFVVLALVLFAEVVPEGLELTV